MSIEQELEDYITIFKNLSSRFIKSNSFGLFLNAENTAEFKRSILEVIASLDDELGASNFYSNNIQQTFNSGSGGYFGGPSYACTIEVIGIIAAAIKQIRRNHSKPESAKPLISRDSYVDLSRIEQLKALQSTNYDFQRLIRLCEELNIANQSDSLMSIAMLVRSIINHVPPIFAKNNFSEVANNYSNGGDSFSKSMKHLNVSLRNVADAHLNIQIRSHDVLPVFTQVDFRSDLDLLISEIIRVCNQAHA